MPIAHGGGKAGLPLGEGTRRPQENEHRNMLAKALSHDSASALASSRFASSPRWSTSSQHGRVSRGLRNRDASGACRFVATAAKTSEISVYLTGLDSVTLLNTVTVRSGVDGQGMTVRFCEGQLVCRGDLLDPRPFQVQLTRAEGQMVRNQALLKNAQLDLKRYRMLDKQDSIARQQLDAQASLVQQHQGAVEAHLSQVDNARLQFTYSRITAPISGRLGLHLVDPGKIVHATDPGALVVITLQPISVISHRRARTRFRIEEGKALGSTGG